MSNMNKFVLLTIGGTLFRTNNGTNAKRVYFEVIYSGRTVILFNGGNSQ